MAEPSLRDSPGFGGTGWLCDKCGERIQTAHDGVLEWVNVSETDSHWEGPRMFIVHHLLASPLKDRPGRYGCYISQDEQRRTLTTTSWGHLDQFLGADGLMRMLSMISAGSAPVTEVLDTIQRLHIPLYEQARPHLPAALADGVIEPNLPDGCHWQRDLQRVIDHYSTQD